MENLSVGVGVAAILLTSVAPDSATAQSYNGIYVTAEQYPEKNNNTRKIAQMAYSQPFVDGVLVVLHWQYLEPVAPGQTVPAGTDIDSTTGETFCATAQTSNYCWQELTEQLPYIGSKNISIAVIAGGYTPSWLYNSTYSVTNTGPILYASKGGTGSNCVTISLPLVSAAPLTGGAAPSSFAAQYVDMMQALQSELQSAGVLGQVKIVKISGGVNTITEEFHLDASTDSGSCSSNTTGSWSTLGYTPSATETAWEYIASNVASLYSGTLLSLDILEDSYTSSPLIDDAGVIFTTRQYKNNPSMYGTLLLDSVLNDLVPGLNTPGILGSASVAVQWNGLAPADQQTLSTTATHTIAAGDRGASIGWQANEAGGDSGSSCGTAACATATSTSTICYGTTATCVAEYQSLLDNGITPIPGDTLKASYIEVWATDVNTPCLSGPLVQAHNALTGSSLSNTGTCQ